MRFKARELTMTVLSRLARAPVQLIISATLFAAICGYQYGRASPGNISFDTKATASLLTSIATVTALVTTVTFALMVFTLNQVNSRKHDLFFRFKNHLFEFDKFLKDYSATDDLINDALALSYDLKSVKIDEFPLMDWDDRIEGWVSAMEEWNERKAMIHTDQATWVANDDPHLVHRILGFLSHLEDIVSEIGMMCLRQIFAGIFIKLVTKALVVLAGLLVTLVICYEVTLPWLVPALVATPVFFVTMAVFMLLEFAYYLHREDRENLSFVDWGDEHSPSDDDEASDERPGWRR
jgi:hypothetical protein